MYYFMCVMLTSDVNCRLTPRSEENNGKKLGIIGPLHDPVTWYKITYTGEQIAQWDFQNNAPAFVLEVPLRNLLTSIYNFVPCDRVVQRAYWPASFSCWHAKYVIKMSPYLVTDPTFRLYELSGLIQELSKSNNPLSNLFCGEGWTKRSFFGPGSPTKKCKRLRVRLARADLTARNMKSCFQHEKTFPIA